MFVSELSIGPGGWVQQSTFVVTGLLIIALAYGIARRLAPGSGRRGILIALVVLGAGLATSGLFTTDPSILFGQQSLEGRIHALVGAAVFTSMPVLCLLVAARGRWDTQLRPLEYWSATAGAGLIVAIAVLKVSEVPELALFAWKGLIQRALLTLFFAWLFTFALHLIRSSANP